MTKDEKLKKFGEGPWMDEPDHVQFEAHGFPCIIHRGPAGAWCGYVGITSAHPFFGRNYSGHYAETPSGDDGEYIPSPVAALDVHGGITYAEKCQGDICHVAKPGEPDDVWWLGFDCAHHGDWSPGQYGLFHETHPHWARPSAGDTYRDVHYVTAETNRLAEQLRDAQ